MIELQIYDDKKKKIEKTYTADGYDLWLGTVEDFMSIIDVEKLDDTKAVAKMVFEGYAQIKPLLKDVFPELTDEEFKRVKVNDVVRCIIQIGTAVVDSLSALRSGN